MADKTVDFELRNEARDFQKFFGKSSRLAPALKRSLRAELRKAVEPVVADVKAEVMKTPGTVSAHRKSTACGLASLPG